MLCTFPVAAPPPPPPTKKDIYIYIIMFVFASNRVLFVSLSLWVFCSLPAQLARRFSPWSDDAQHCFTSPMSGVFGGAAAATRGRHAAVDVGSMSTPWFDTVSLVF